MIFLSRDWYFFYIVWFRFSCTESWILGHRLPHSLAAFMWIVYSSWLSLSFLLKRNLISFFTRRICALLAVTPTTGELFVNFKFGYFGITFLARHCLLKYIWALDLSSLELVFLYKLMVLAWLAINLNLVFTIPECLQNSIKWSLPVKNTLFITLQRTEKIT
jgi:hypothetical protein